MVTWALFSLLHSIQCYRSPLLSVWLIGSCKVWTFSDLLASIHQCQHMHQYLAIMIKIVNPGTTRYKSCCSHIGRQSFIVCPSWSRGLVSWIFSSTLSLPQGLVPWHYVWMRCTESGSFTRKTPISNCITYHIPQANWGRYNTPFQAPQKKILSITSWSNNSQRIHWSDNNTRACLWTTPVEHSEMHNSSEGVKPYAFSKGADPRPDSKAYLPTVLDTKT